MHLKLLALAVASAALSGCYHVTVTSGATPATTVVDKPFQHSFIYGLVPPPEINTRTDCPSGVSKVETERSFINGLVAALTFQIYTPIHVKVTCAAR
jgi:hypothetical protein